MIIVAGKKMLIGKNWKIRT